MTLHVPENIRKNIYDQVEADLRPSRTTVHAKIGGSVAVGGFVSLFLCGQLGFGLSSVAMRVNDLLVGLMGFFGCAAVCGVLFAVLPVATLRLLSSSLQFQALIRREWRAISGWILAFGVGLAYGTNQSDPVWVTLTWSIAALASFAALSRALHELSLLISQLWRRDEVTD